MVHRLLRLLLAAWLFLPTGICPCHLLEQHVCADVHTTLSETDVPDDDHDTDCPQHGDDPCEDCLARQTTESQYTGQIRAAARDTGPAACTLSFAVPCVPILSPASAFTFFRFNFPRDGTPLYLKVRALLL